MSRDTAPPAGIASRAGQLVGSRLWHGLLLAAVLFALVTQTVLVGVEGADANSGSDSGDPGSSAATRLIRLFSYFTEQSNLLVAVVCAGLLLRPHRDGPLWRVLRADALLGIAITGLVFALVLAQDMDATGIGWWVTITFHYVCPPAVLLGWVLFGPRGQLDWRTVARSAVWPFAWLGYTFAHGAFTDWYPYPFIDVTVRGYAGALRNTVLILLLAVVFVLLLRGVDRLLAAVGGVKAQEAPEHG